MSYTMVADIKQDEVKQLRQEIFHLALASPDIETMHWYMRLDDCFENDEVNTDEFGNAVWRLRALSWKKEPVNNLARKVDDFMKRAGYKVLDANDILKTRVVKDN